VSHAFVTELVFYFKKLHAVMINAVDKCSGMYVTTYVELIWQYLSQCVVGATLQPADEEEEEVAEDVDEEKESAEVKAITYEVIGTLSDNASPKPEFVKEIVKVTNVISMHICFSCWINAYVSTTFL